MTLTSLLAPAVLAPALLVALAVLVLAPPPRRPTGDRAAAGRLILGAGPVAVVVAQRRRLARAWGRRRLAAARQRQVIDLCDGLAAELRAGSRPADALLACADSDLLAAAAAAARGGGDVPSALRAASVASGAGGLAWLAACWSVAAARGSGLAEGIDRIGRALRAEQAVHREVEAQLAVPRATAKVLAALPAVGLALGTALGAAPVPVLLGTPAGAACLVVGVTLAAAGLVWVDRLAQRADPRR